MSQSSLPVLRPNRAGLSWALVPVALLLSSTVGVGAMAIVAARDPHFATEPDYYQKAIQWDRTQAQAATNQRLGFAVHAPTSLHFDDRGQADLELTLSDDVGRRVEGAQLVAQAFANAYSGELVRLAFDERSPGHYQAKLTVQHPGLWVFRVAGNAGNAKFTADFRADLTPSGAR